MKNISLSLNIVLLLAVGFLYYKQFSGSKNAPAVAAVGKDSLSPAVALPAVPLSVLPKNIPLVFVNADSIFAKYDFAKKAKAAGEVKVGEYRKSYQAKVDAFQKDYNDYVQKAGAGGYTKEQGTEIEKDLQKRKDEIMMMEQNQDKVMGELDNSNAEIQKKIYEYVTRFNKQHGYYCVLAYTKAGGGVLGVSDSLDVTPQILSGLNAEYKAGKGK